MVNIRIQVIDWGDEASNTAIDPSPWQRVPQHSRFNYAMYPWGLSAPAWINGHGALGQAVARGGQPN